MGHWRGGTGGARLAAACLFLVPPVPAAADGLPEQVSFRRDVMGIITKAGCSGGGCHGAADGKGGLKLSLFGDHPADDFRALMEGDRRVRRDDPASSWMVRKPTLDIDHEGGERIAFGSEEHQTLLRWIEQGAELDDPAPSNTVAELRVEPADAVLIGPDWTSELLVTAVFGDGTERDATPLARYEPSNLLVNVSAGGIVSAQQPAETAITVQYLGARAAVRAAFLPASSRDWSWPDDIEPINRIDELVFAKLRKVRLTPAAVCDDSTFVRRATLDLCGRLPTADEARGFVADESPDKRARLVDQLLASPEFADFWALKWADLLRVEEKTLDERGVKTFHGWIRERIADGTPIDEFARAIITGRGSTYENPPANFYRAIREPAARSESTAQVFLGTRLGCAKCHNHPFEKWTQDDYYQFAALFDRIDYEIVANDRKDKFDKHQFIGEQVVHVFGEPEMKDPRTGFEPAPALLGDDAPPIDSERDRFEQAAAWLTAPDRPLFARVQANRIWSHLLGRGIVHPADDFRSTNPASNPELLHCLTEAFIGSGFDLRALIRLIAASRTYQADAQPQAGSEHDAINFSSATIRRLPAEPLLDAIRGILDAPAPFAAYDGRARAVAMPGVDSIQSHRRVEDGDRFLKLFGKPKRLIASDCERSDETSLGQVFALTSGEMIAEMLEDDDNRLADLEDVDPDAAIAELFWSALARPPSDDERRAVRQHFDSAPSPRHALEDAAWAVINSKEFLFRR